MDNILNSTVEMSQAELILQLAKTNVEQEKRLKTTELRLSALEEEIKSCLQSALVTMGAPPCHHISRGTNYRSM